MNDLTTATQLNAPEQSKLANKVRFVTAASLFDGHDASINIMRRILQSQGAEVVHLDPLGQGAQMVATIATAFEPHPLAGRDCELA